MKARGIRLKVGVVLAGHGVPATDCPPEWIGELMGLEWSGHAGAGGGPHVRERIRELDAKIRGWPRTPGNDPYKQGLERLAGVLRPHLPTKLFAIGYNEFCGPSVADAVRQVIGLGAERVLVIPSMLTPGGVHSERDIPRTLEGLRRENPGVAIDYVWPFELKEVARLLERHIRRRISGASSSARRSTGRRQQRR